MQLFVASVICVLLALSFPGIVSRLENNITQCGDFFFQGKGAVFPGILIDSVTQNDFYKIICQTYNNKIRFATLYDTKNKIPFSSAYKYTGTYETNTNTVGQMGQLWMTESQLEPSGAEMSEPFDKQARNQDYWIKKNIYKCTPGALFPMSHAADKETAESTLTLTNSVPLKDDFKEGLWSLVEKTTKEDMDSNCRDNNNNIVAYVLTGAIAGNNKLNNRVNIPSFVWTAFCCFNRETPYSRGFWAENKPRNATNIKLKSLKVLQEYLSKKLRIEVELFSNNCSVNASQLRPQTFRRRQSRIKCIRVPQQMSSFGRKCYRVYPSRGYPYNSDPSYLRGYPYNSDPLRGYPYNSDPLRGYPYNSDPSYPSRGYPYNSDPSYLRAYPYNSDPLRGYPYNSDPLRGYPYNSDPSYPSQGNPYNRDPSYPSRGNPYNSAPSYPLRGYPYNRDPSYPSRGNPYKSNPSYPLWGYPYKSDPSYPSRGNPYNSDPLLF